MVTKLGPEGSKQYFYYLQRFLSLKLSKVEFNKLCLRVLGRENIPLHNQLIRSILKNACCVKSPPPASHKDDASKYRMHVGGQETPSDGYQQNGSHIGMAQASGSPGLSNGGDMLPVSPRKARSSCRDRRSGDRRSALGLNGKTSFPQLSAATQPLMENGDWNPPDSGRPVQQAEHERENLMSHPAKMPVVRISPDGPAAVYNKGQMELVVRNDRKEASSRSPLQAPLGVPFCPVSTGGACRTLPAASGSRSIGTFDDGTLLDSRVLRDRMEHIALAHGLEGVSMDCANILNHGLDSYIKGLLRSCIELVGARSGHEFTKNNAHKNHIPMKLVNGVKPGHQYHMPNSSLHQYQMPNNGAHQYQMQEQKVLPPISFQEFRVAMELNPRQLGEDWPLLLEKICTHAFEE
ncbi:hypothetical protein C2S53_011667 [Perilla frutescens var. hirtella]|uniref:Uncharacterized protein n=1 Tax=Perilla frutescens var. hirtella TaxID=608512 RepID=A0AAD4J9C8_PERFH|nr:hypothetical protein C2S53_011667 [Perilla frutescens var. hirtella]